MNNSTVLNPLEIPKQVVHTGLPVWVYLVIGFLVICIVVLFVLYFYNQQYTSASISNIQAENEAETKSLRNTIKNKDGIQGPQGLMGQQGPAGQAGGTFLNQGSLRNKLKPNLFLDRTEASDTDTSIAFLREGDMGTNQYWVLESNGQLKNQAGDDCLEILEEVGDGVNGKVRMKQCDSENGKQKWSWDKYGRITSAENPNMCLAVESNVSGSIQTSSMLDNGLPVETSFPNPYYLVELKECGESNTVKGNESSIWLWS